MTTTVVDPGAWIRRYHDGAATGRRLVCFPHAGGSASFFLPVSRALSPVAEVLCVQYPGRQERRKEPPIGSLHRLADDIAPILADQPDRDTVLFGHSLGAALAFEVAHRLESRYGRPPAHLVVSGRRAPDVVRGPNWHTRPDEALVGRLRDLSGTDARLLADPEMVEMILPALRSDYEAIETYRIRPGTTVRCPMTVLTGDADEDVTLDEAERWRAHTSGPSTVKVYPGGHFFLVDRAEEVMSVLRAVLSD